MKLVYVAGPFRGPDHWEIAKNIRSAEALALEVWRAGAVAICPHLNTMHFQGAAPDEVWLEGDLEMLRRCDAILMTQDWKRSTGATEELRFAVKNNIDAFFTIDALKDWIKTGVRRNENVLDSRASHPHCDQRVLHAPGECVYCDKYPDHQELRSVWGLNFTGHREPGKLVCPAEQRRPIDLIEAWFGNRRAS